MVLALKLFNMTRVFMGNIHMFVYTTNTTYILPDTITIYYLLYQGHVIE